MKKSYFLRLLLFSLLFYGCKKQEKQTLTANYVLTQWMKTKQLLPDNQYINTFSVQEVQGQLFTHVVVLDQQKNTQMIDYQLINNQLKRKKTITFEIEGEAYLPDFMFFINDIDTIQIRKKFKEIKKNPTQLTIKKPTEFFDNPPIEYILD